MTQHDPIPNGTPELAALSLSKAAERARLDGLDGLEAGDAARQLETLFLRLLVKEMRKAIPGEGLFGSGPGSSIYESLFDDALAQAMAEGPGVGMREQLGAALLGEGAAASPGATGAPQDATPDQAAVAGSDNKAAAAARDAGRPSAPARTAP